jgi:hypothetical protein
MSAPGNDRKDMEIADPEAARKQVRQITSSGGKLFRRVPTAENLNINMLLKYFCLNLATKILVGPPNRFLIV